MTWLGTDEPRLKWIPSEPKCGAKEFPQYGCGHERLNARFNFYICELPQGHEGFHEDKAAQARWGEWDA